jgi:16S rRNA (guanine1516-N2)-methyltransferase
MISLCPSSLEQVHQAQVLAHRWGLNFSDSPSVQEQYYLLLTAQRLQLMQSGIKKPNPVYVDFFSGQTTHRRLFGGGKNQTMAKAVRLNKSPLPTILDATAGLGKDAFIFASLGAEVILMERSPIAAALLSDGLQRASLVEDIREIIARMSFVFGDARELVSETNDTTETSQIVLKEQKSPVIKTPDVIYLDPMFPHRKKSAQVKKEMLAFQNIIGADSDSHELLDTCRQLAKNRVVVKRPIKAAWLADIKPTLCLKMKKHRFDIYLN